MDFAKINKDNLLGKEDFEAHIKSQKPRSAWEKGVHKYQKDLLDIVFGDDPNRKLSRSEFEKAALGGAEDWKQASYGGSHLIFDKDIAERLSTPSELKMATTKKGLRGKPNAFEKTWLDTQARALGQANSRLIEAYFKKK